MTEKKPYRPCVLAVFKNDKDLLLVCQRVDNGAWQFPQGGVDEGESDKEALYREVLEEIAVAEFDILKQSKKTIFYDFPQELRAPITKRYRGQEQRWFLCQMKPPFLPNLSKATTNEFQDFKWDKVADILDGVIEWKKDSYLKGLRSLGVLHEFK